jgi:hypothetical protein
MWLEKCCNSGAATHRRGSDANPGQPMEFVVGKVALWQRLLQVHRFFLINFHSTNDAYSSFIRRADNGTIRGSSFKEHSLTTPTLEWMNILCLSICRCACHFALWLWTLSFSVRIHSLHRFVFHVTKKAYKFYLIILSRVFKPSCQTTLFGLKFPVT